MGLWKTDIAQCKATLEYGKQSFDNGKQKWKKTHTLDN